MVFMYSSILMLLHFFSTPEEKGTLIYVGDPMCSWCYGIAPELDKVKTHFKEDIDYEIVMGGLRPYNTQTMLELKEFLKSHWEEVEHRSGQKFNTQILDESQITYDTEPPSRAVAIVRAMEPSKAFDFFHACQTAFYLENKNMHLVESYKEISNSLEINFEAFKAQFESEEWKLNIRKDFQLAQELGVRNFPTILFKKGNEIHPLAQGFSTAEKIIKRINTYL